MFHVIVHTPAQACAALQAAQEAGIPIVLHSPSGAAHSLGSGYFIAMIETARRQWPAVDCLAILDCAAAAGFALAALRAGVKAVSVEGSPALLDKIADIAAQLGGRLCPPPPEGAIDLRDRPNPLATIQALLAADSTAVIKSSQND